MTAIKIHRLSILVKWTCIGVILSSSLGPFVLDVAAQDPTPIPTPTPAPTWTPGPGATNTPTPDVTAGPTPISPTATPDNRLVDFRVDKDEIDNGECVQFSWVVRGDIDRIEFNEVDDGKDPILVADQDDREECPDDDTDYELIVRWLNGTKTTKGIEIEVHSDSGSGSSSGSSGDQSSTSTTVGSFIPVTPIALTSLTPEAEPASETSVQAEAAVFQQVTQEDTSARPRATPAGLLQSVKSLPDTGGIPQLTTGGVENQKLLSGQVEAKESVGPARRVLWLVFATGLALLSGTMVAGLVLLTRSAKH